MALFLIAASLILLYGAAYAVFCIKKGGIAAALGMILWLVTDLGLLALVLYYRTNT